MSLRDKLQLQRLIRQVSAAGKATPGGATAFAGLDVTAFASAADVAAKPDLSGATPQPVGTAVPGAGAAASRADHVHAHGDQAGGTLHAAASGAAAGFMAAADKSKIDGLSPARAAWPATPQIGADGVMEVGKFLDFHEASGNPTDFDNRLMSAGADNLQLNGKRLGTLGTTTPWTVQPGSSPGSSAEAAHADHAHGFDDTSHGSRGGGSLHAAATGAAAGFLSAADKSKLDSFALVAASYAVTAAQSMNSGSTLRINYGYRLTDTHSAVTVGTGVWQFKAPVAGLYHVSCILSLEYVSGTVSTPGEVWLELSGATGVRLIDSCMPMTGNPVGWSGSALVSLNLNDVVYFQGAQSSGAVWRPRYYSFQGPARVDIYRIPGS